MVNGPKTLLEAAEYFKNEYNCIRYLAAKRWPDGVVKCPTCGGDKASFLENQKRYQCSARHPKRQFSIRVGTIMEDSPIGLDKWLPVLWLIANCRNGISSWELHRSIGVTQKTAWFMLHRVRLAMQDDLTGGSLSGEVEIDETFIGGKVRNMHKARKERAQVHSQLGDTSIVLGALERASKRKRVRNRDRNRKQATMQEEFRGIVEPGSQIHSDEYAAKWHMDDEYTHNVVNHLEAYLQDNVHTNGVENFWSLLKRGLGGT